MEEKTWAVVKFPEDNDAVEAVPSTWLNGNKCYWPPYTANSRKLCEALEKHAAPENHWQQFNIVPFRNNVFDDYSIAKKKAAKAIETSDLESDSHTLPKKRTIKMKKTYSFSSTEENVGTSSLPDPPSMICSISGNTLSKTTSSCSNSARVNVLKNIRIQSPVAGLDENMTTYTIADVHHELSDIEIINLEPQNPHNPLQLVEDLYPNNPNNEIGIKHVYNMLQRVLRKQELLHVVVGDIKEMVEQLEKKIVAGQVDDADADSIHTKFNFPINSLETLTEFEQYLGSDEGIFKKVVREISLLGGKDVYDFVYRAGKLLITNKFASEYSYHGRRTKTSFKALNLNKLLIRAALHINKTTTEKDVEVQISKWLKRAAERAKKE